MVGKVALGPVGRHLLCPDIGRFQADANNGPGASSAVRGAPDPALLVPASCRAT